MKKLSLKNQLLNYLRSDTGWIHGGEIERMTIAWGYKGSTGSRECRSLVEDGKILRMENEKGHVLYKAVPPKEVREYRVNGVKVAPDKLIY